VLYTTFNDFMADHAEYDLQEARKGNLSFFILDDSTDPVKWMEIDAFSNEYNCHVIRRSDRSGYKAGAVNHWVDQLGQEYDYFFILDSDSRASIKAINYCVELAKRDRKLAIIQTKTLTMTSTPTRMTKSSVTVQHAYMEIVQKAMKNLGTSPYYGHNALVKIEALRLVGGFVEESNEDYKTLARMYQKGYRSLYAEKAITWEEVPPDYMSSRSRALRWSRDAVTQMSLLKYGGPEAVGFFLFYGWVTHMSNVALISLLPLLTMATFPHLFGNGMILVASSATLSVIILWPLLALRIDDPELTLRKMGKALFWGSVYNIPMMAPVSVQIVKTSVTRFWLLCKRVAGFPGKPVEVFVVTPKKKEIERTLASVLSNKKAEIALGVGIILVALISQHVWSIFFALPQILSAIALPLLVFYESRAIHSGYRKPWAFHKRIPYYLGGTPNPPTAELQRLLVR
ncbi:MAG: glycosyltransferase family 2 protein, partial [Nitrososphaerales archaeon]